jgi:hypothetical protein
MSAGTVEAEPGAGPDINADPIVPPRRYAAVAVGWPMIAAR